MAALRARLGQMAIILLLLEVGLCHGTIILPSRATASGHTIVRLRDRLADGSHQAHTRVTTE
eukprot:1598348-Prymnesium_polylepis.1